MKTKFTFAFLVMLFISTATIAQSTIFPAGQSWKYLDDGSNQGTAWRATAFDDSSWATGNAQLGYGDGDETTVVSYGPDENNKYPTTYFRYSFTADAMQAAFNNLVMEAIRDDGMVVYLNGTEVWRDNMAGGTINYDDYASSTIGGGDESTWQSNTIPNALVVGTNVIAVEIHNRSASSSDISFDFRLFGTAVSTEYVEEGDTWKYLDDGSNQGTAWRANGFNDTSWSSGDAELGYGDGDETTVVSFGGDSNNKHITTYFRKSFTVADASIFGTLSLEAIRDDGMVVYINGTEVWRDGMTSGSIDYLTQAQNTVGSSDEDTWITNEVVSNLVNGTNTVAVEIHQTSPTSSDISFNFKLTANGIVPAEIVRGPYLQTGTSTSVIVKWRTNTPTESMINYGTSLGSLTNSVTDNTAKLNHELLISGLSPNTTYYYEIEDNDGVYVPASSDMYITTAPSIGTDQFVRAWILGDAGTANQNQRNVRDQYYSYVQNATTNPNQTDMMLFLGDNAYNSGTDSEYQDAFFNIYDDMLKKSVAWSTLGNHDGYSANSSSQSGPYYDIFSFPTAAEAGGLTSGTEAYYSFDYANIHFIVLESYTLDDDPTQLAWVEADLQATTQDWIVAFYHHPSYTKGSHNSDSETQLVNMRNIFQPVLEQYGVDLVLNGHSHSYERSFFINGHYGLSNSFNSGTHTVGTNGNLSGKDDTPDGAYEKAPTQAEGAVYITTGSAGKISGGNLNHAAMYTSLNQLGSCVMEVDSDGGTGQNLTVKFITDSGTITDYFTINKSGLTLSTENNELSDSDVKVYPVPTNSILNIEISLKDNLKDIKIYDTVGKLVKETTKSKVNVASLRAGMYMVQITTDNGEYYKNIIIE